VILFAVVHMKLRNLLIQGIVRKPDHDVKVPGTESGLHQNDMVQYGSVEPWMAVLPAAEDLTITK
jgi:hypothetical protein